MSICGQDCCTECARLVECSGCEKVKGHPFGGDCVAAKCVERGGCNALPDMKSNLINEINSLGIEGLNVSELYLLNGNYVNLTYPLSNHTTVQFLNDKDVYFGSQIEKADSDRCYGVVANEEFILVCEYGCDGTNPELLLYKRRV